MWKFTGPENMRPVCYVIAHMLSVKEIANIWMRYYWRWRKRPQWQDVLNQIISEHSDCDGWLNYDRACDCMVAVAEYLEECLPVLLRGDQVEDAAKLVMRVYGAVWGQDMDDLDGGLSIVAEHCREAMEKYSLRRIVSRNGRYSIWSMNL